MGTAKCRSCGATIVWVLTQAGKRMPIDATPRADGNVQIKPDGSAQVLKADELADVSRRCSLEGHTPRLFTSHFATCPSAASHRKKPAADPPAGPGATRKCPFCELMVTPDLFCCRAHWFKLKDAEQKEVYAAYQEWKDGTIGAADLRLRQQAVIVAVRKRQPKPAEPTLFDAPKE